MRCAENLDKNKRVCTPKQTMNNFARANPDLLHVLPVRELNIFVKKYKAFPKRTLDRKFRAATARLTNLYTDFQMDATFNGQPSFQVCFVLHLVTCL